VNILLKVLRIVLAVIAMVLAGYSLKSSNYEVMPYMMFFMGAMILVIGIEEIQEARRAMGIFSIIVSVFVFYVSLEGLLLN
jgi:zinc transporter ZupT